MLRRTLSVFAAAAIATVLLVPVAAIGSHDFVDVPDGHTFHSHISWLADNEVTFGCNPPANDQYCPDANVTRGQMAAFMKRLAEGKIVDAATATMSDDAALLEGKSVDDLMTLTFADMELALGTGIFALGDAEMMDLEFEVPVAGSVVITHSTSLLLGEGPTAIAVVPTLTGCDFFAFEMSAFAQVTAEDEYDSAAGVVAYNVEAGPHTISYCGSTESADVDLINAQLAVVFEPGGVVPVIEPPPILMADGADFWAN